MSIERLGQFIEFVVPGENGGIRAMARINAIALVLEADCIGDELLLSVGGKTFHVSATIDQFREILAEISRKQPRGAAQ